MSTQTANTPIRYCGRLFTVEEIERIRRLIASEPKLNRAQLSRRVCDELHWHRPDERRKDMSCRVAMLRMERDGLITLPPPQKGNGNGRTRPRLTTASDPQEPLSLPAGALRQIQLHPVQTPQDSSLWNELIERYRYLKYKPLPGAQMRYLVFHGSHLLAALGFSAAAWNVAPRDRFIGWDHDGAGAIYTALSTQAKPACRSRFLILPWVEVRNLASCILAAAAKRLGNDWKERYGYEPLLLETFGEA